VQSICQTLITIKIYLASKKAFGACFLLFEVKKQKQKAGIDLQSFFTVSHHVDDFKASAYN